MLDYWTIKKVISYPTIMPTKNRSIPTPNITYTRDYAIVVLIFVFIIITATDIQDGIATLRLISFSLSAQIKPRAAMIDAAILCIVTIHYD